MIRIIDTPAEVVEAKLQKLLATMNRLRAKRAKNTNKKRRK